MKKKQTDTPITLTADNDEKKIIWFPGHMIKAMNKIKERLALIDVVLEVRDARLPLITGNAELKSLIGDKKLLIVVNKANLANPEKLKTWESWFEKQGDPYIFVNCLDPESLKKALQETKQLVNKGRQQADPRFKKKIKLMIVGLPNTGKSTIINRLSGRNATKVADKPGQTRQQLWVKATDNIQILDNPGVMPSVINNYEEGIWLAAIHAIPEKIVEPEDTATYIVKYLLETKSELFKQKYKLETLDTDLIGALDQIAKNRGYLRRGNQFDYDRVYKIVLADFRKGDLGLISFTLPPK